MPETEPVNTEPYRLRIGSYGVLHPLGTGGMSSVYRAVHVESGHEVALKVLPPFLARNPTVLKRFMGEAKSAEALEHPNIVSIYDRGSDQGRHYLVLEYVKGGDLHEYVQRGGPMAPVEAIEAVVQVVKGLEYAASRGLIHRDIKPSNLLRTPDGEIKIADLGLALRSEAEDERVTREGTTVGTVDYMAPEQARDSRATSFQSDIYSLGCTLYYLLTALPPYPGGDIADKLTRHARNPAPDVRDLRPDLPPTLSALVQQMMAKRPEDRFGSYPDLRSALAKTARDVVGDESSIALVPIEDDRHEPARPARVPPVGGLGESHRPNSSVPEISLATLAPVFFDESPATGPQAAHGPSPLGSVLPRLGAEGAQLLAEPLEDGGPFGVRGSSISATAWVARCVVLGVLAVVVIIGLDLLLRGPITPPAPRTGGDHALAPVLDHAEFTAPSVPRQSLAPRVDQRPSTIVKEPTEPSVVETWVEPLDEEPIRMTPTRYTPEVLIRYLPIWGRTQIPDQIDGPMTLVRRVPETREPGTVSSLRHALDVPKGTVEICDAGPFMIDDFRVPGETRLIRARPGYRPVVQIDGPQLQMVRDLPGVVTLDNRNLTLDSLDLVVNVRELPVNQRALFHCAGAQLTLKNCTITIVNPFKTPFTFLRADDPGGRTSRVRIEKCFIRGDVASLFELKRGPVELMVDRSVLASEGPIVRTPSAPTPAEHRLHLLGNVLACRGPCIDLGAEGRSDPPPKRLVVRAFDTTFGRFQGAGTSSLTATENPSASLAERIDWLGDNNLFLGWRGYFAAGPEHTILTRNLPAFRSTWSAIEQHGQEIFVEWPPPAAIADLITADLAPFLPGREALLELVARPRPFLLAKTLLSFPAPPTPVLKLGSTAPAVATAKPGQRISQEVRIEPGQTEPPRPRPVTATPEGGPSELVFDADSAEWKGDLGAFLREKVVGPARRLRVRVRGAGPKRCSPVRLPDGTILEMQVDKPKGAEDDWLTWIPTPQATGRALIELHGGALTLSQFRIQAEDDCKLESLLHVDDGFLVLQRCELTGSQAAAPGPTRLITYRAASTRPRPVESELFATPWDRPVCLVSECILITGGAGIHAEIGLGFVGLSNCVVAARGDVVSLAPALVARDRFNADLRFDHCTIAAGAAVVRVAAWSGGAPGPDRPWLISSANTAFLDLLTRESVLLRADVEAIAQGQVFCQQTNDAVEVFGFAEAGQAPVPNRTRDIVPQWINLWGSNHIQAVTGPRVGAAPASVRFLERPRPGRLEPADLVLDPNHHPGRTSLDVGAPPALLGSRPRSPIVRKR
ncbi:MAG: serine/threonine-protein kinase [Paludisphaera borealis]|uniref:serine/threonine protein kinase n=1 Tax=Paludisphaera borealis TaxID=1387353 RepID=UPI00283C23D9|nr:serine/threonine-protein kinase [Paludisphaera borealis]MDR3620257.1 serine/threonine-protein kinase [Paludisphaera borealis]